MADIDRWSTHVAEAALARAQAKIDILEITALETFRQTANGIEAGSRYIEAKSGAVWRVDYYIPVAGRSNPVEQFDVVPGAERVVFVRVRKVRDLAVVG